jgi:hypothetical protein
MSNEMIGNFVYLYFILGTVAIVRWGCEILDNYQQKRKDGKAETKK